MTTDDPAELSALFAQRINLRRPDAAAMVLGESDQADLDREAIRWHGCDQRHAWFAGVCGRCGALRGLDRPRPG